MSRTATATPPPTYFPQKPNTPTLRHSSAPSLSQSHFKANPHTVPKLKRRFKHLPSSLTGLHAKKPASTADVAEEDATPEDAPVVDEHAIVRRDSITSSASLAPSSSDDGVSHSISRRGSTLSDGAPSMTASFADSFDSTASTNLPTPTDTEESFVIQQNLPTQYPASLFDNIPGVQRSWVPNFRGMAKAVTTSFTFERKRHESPAIVPAPVVPIVNVPLTPPQLPVVDDYCPTPRIRPIPEDLVAGLSAEDKPRKEREWMEAEHKRIAECAALCSQWPRSGYNVAKFGPHGARTYYEPQSSCNVEHVRGLLVRQQDLEIYMRDHQLSYFPSRRARDDSDNASDPSVESFDSSLPSPTTSMLISADDAAAAVTAANLRAAMATSLISANSSQVSLAFPPSPRSLKNAKSLTELDIFSSSMALSSTSDLMEIDSETSSLLQPPSEGFHARPNRAQSCGSKRPMSSHGDDEEKRRKVDEAMVVEEAVSTGVIMPSHQLPPSALAGKDPRLSASTPNLGEVKSVPSAVFGHVVKTSDTHPIIISPFFPAELLPVLAENLVMPPTTPWSTTPLLMSNHLDVPAMLLSYTPSPASNLSKSATLVPSPIRMTFPYRWGTRTLGNLLLSSCPGKRLRMEGPVKGRGPICRDLTTDLRRIRGEGVGCVVCCLDDAELALLGVPWETYREIANDVGLDIIRLPMPDGFTPVSIRLFDSQISLIASRYTLRGINVLVHCRGGVGRAGLTACAWAIKMGFVQPHPSLLWLAEADNQSRAPEELEHQIVMSVVERVIAMIRSRRGLKAIESFEQVQFLAAYVRWLRAAQVEA